MTYRIFICDWGSWASSWTSSLQSITVAISSLGQQSCHSQTMKECKDGYKYYPDLLAAFSQLLFPSYFFQRESFKSFKTKTSSLKSVQECPKEKKHANAMFLETSTWHFIQHDLSIKGNQQMFGGDIPPWSGVYAMLAT